jgi:hypothetical protein
MPAQADKLEERLRSVEASRDAMQGSIGTLRHFVYWSIPLAVVLTTGLVGLGWHYVGACQDIARHGEHLKAADERLRAAEDGLRAAEKKSGELAGQLESIRGHIRVIVDRQGKDLPNVPNALVYHGRIKRLDATEIAILPDDIGEPVWAFRLQDGPVRVRVNQKAAALADLKLGMRAAIFPGKTLMIDAE